VEAIKASIPLAAHRVPLADANLPDRVYRALFDADFRTVGQVMEQLALDEDRILGLEGFGPKMLDDLKAALAAVQLPAEVAEAPEAQPEAATAPAEAPVAEVATAEAVAPAVETPVAGEAVAAAPEGEAAVAVEGAAEATEEESTEEEADKDDDSDDKKGGKKKGKKKGAVEITYDEDLGMFITRKKRKPGRAKDDMFGGLDDE
jgi:hypothetical protein